MKNNMKIILASASKQRQDILNMIGLEYEVITSLVEEKSNEREPSKYVEELSLNKANSVATQINQRAIIISADTIIYCNGKKYEKPKTKEEAFKNMKEFSGKIVMAYTGTTIMDLYKNKTITFSNCTNVKLREIEDDEILWYINNEEKIFKCCGFVPLGKGAIFIDKIDGDYNNLFGLSPSLLFSKLGELGYKLEEFEFENN